MSQSTARYCDSSAAVKPGLSMNILSITSFSSKLLTDSVLEMLSSKQDTPTPWLMRIVFFFCEFQKKLLSSLNTPYYEIESPSLTKFSLHFLLLAFLTQFFVNRTFS